MELSLADLKATMLSLFLDLCVKDLTMDSVGTTALHQVEIGLQAYDVEVRGNMPTLLFHRLYLRVLIRGG